MKHFFYTISLSFLSFTATYSQTLQVGGGLGIGSMFTSGLGVATGYHLNAKYFLQDNLAVGLDYSRFWAGASNSRGDEKAIFSPIIAFADYYFSPQNIKGKELSPYVGVGIGSFSLGGSSGGFTLTEAHFGIQPRVGAVYNLSDALLLDGNISYSKPFSSEVDIKGLLAFKVGIAYKFSL